MSMQTPAPSVLEELFNSLPPVEDKHLPPLLNPNNGQCVFCKKFAPMRFMPIINTGIVIAQEPLCPACVDTFKEQSRIVCVKCKLVVLWVDPHKDNTGFTFHRRKSYHIKECPTCAPGITQAQVLEKLVYYKANNIPFE
jgi:ribosomal protein S27AE